MKREVIGAIVGATIGGVIGGIAAAYIGWYGETIMARDETQYRARITVRWLEKNGTLCPPDDRLCLTCGYRNERMVAHHYNGYDEPLSIWWVCFRCNKILKHTDNKMPTLEEARQRVRGLYSKVSKEQRLDNLRMWEDELEKSHKSILLAQRHLEVVEAQLIRARLEYDEG